LAHISIFNEHGVDFISVSDGVNTASDSPFGRLQLQLLGVISEYEKSLIKERVLSGLAAARAKGRIGGRPGLPQETKDQILHLLSQGLHPRNIASECRTSIASVYKQRKLALVS
jgi:DNA invertase Pin-like site-specific DNA recombinase